MESHTEFLRRQHTIVIVIGQGKDAQQHRLRQAGLAKHFNGGVSLNQTGEIVGGICNKKEIG